MALARMTIMARTISSSPNLRSVAENRAQLEFLQLTFLEVRLVLGRHRIAGKHDCLALIAGSAIEPIDCDPFRGRLEQQSVVICLALLGFGAQLDFRSRSVRHRTTCFDRQITARQ